MSHPASIFREGVTAGLDPAANKGTERRRLRRTDAARRQSFEVPSRCHDVDRMTNEIDRFACRSDHGQRGDVREVRFDEAWACRIGQCRGWESMDVEDGFLFDI